MAILAVCLAAAAGTTIAVAAPAPAAPAADNPDTAPMPPLILPDAATISRTGTTTEPSCPGCRMWIVGGTPGSGTARIAARHGARPEVPGLGIYRISRDEASGFARSLDRAGRLAWAEPDTPIRSAAYPDASLAYKQTWLDQIVNPADTTPPPVDGGSPLIGLVEQGIDPAHPDLLAANLTGATPTGQVELDSHGTSVAGIIGAPGGLIASTRGVWPHARMQHFPAGGLCSTAAAAVIDAVRAGVSVINISYTMPRCYTHYLATEYAVSRNVLTVAAAGNTGNQGNAVVWPAADPHVVSVGAVDGAGLVAPFSSRNRFVDVAAPGADVFAPLTRATTSSGGEQIIERDWGPVDGTSFSAPMVSATAAWLRQARPTLSASQTARILSSSADDLGTPGRDPLYGDGLIDIESALIAPTPVADPLEPNDDIPLLKGTGLIPKAKYLWKNRPVALRATLSRAKDPADVYRIRIPARRQILITAAQLAGDVKLTALKPSATSLNKTAGKVIVKTDRPFPRTEGIKVKNLNRKPGDIWLAVTPSPRDNTDSSTYRLKIRRTR